MGCGRLSRHGPGTLKGRAMPAKVSNAAAGRCSGANIRCRKNKKGRKTEDEQARSARLHPARLPDRHVDPAFVARPLPFLKGRLSIGNRRSRQRAALHSTWHSPPELVRRPSAQGSHVGVDERGAEANWGRSLLDTSSAKLPSADLGFRQLENGPFTPRIGRKAVSFKAREQCSQ